MIQGVLGAKIRIKELIVAIDPLDYTIVRANLYSGVCIQACQLAEALWEQLSIHEPKGIKELSPLED